MGDVELLVQVILGFAGSDALDLFAGFSKIRVEVRESITVISRDTDTDAVVARLEERVESMKSAVDLSEAVIEAHKRWKAEYKETVYKAEELVKLTIALHTEALQKLMILKLLIFSIRCKGLNAVLDEFGPDFSSCGVTFT